jgi:hypothetical protein
MEIVSALTENPILKNNKKLLTRIDNFIKTPETTDGQVISYTEWLIEKIE